MILHHRRDWSFSLVEVALALGVAAVSLLVIFSLLPIGLQTNQRSIEQTVSADILSAVAADLRATPVTSPRGGATTSTQFGMSIPAAIVYLQDMMLIHMFQAGPELEAIFARLKPPDAESAKWATGRIHHIARGGRREPPSGIARLPS